MHNPVDEMLSDFFRYHMDLYQAHYSFIVQRNASVDHVFFFHLVLLLLNTTDRSLTT